LRKTINKTLRILFFLSVGIFSIWWFLEKLEPEEKTEIWELFKRAEYIWLLLAMLTGLIACYLRALRWNLLIQPLKVKPKPLHTFIAVAIGYLGNFIIPRFGELARCAVLKKLSGASFSSLFGTVIAERIIDMLVYILLFFIGLFFFFKQIVNQPDGLFSNFSVDFFVNIIIAMIFLLIVFFIIAYILYRKRGKFKKINIINKLIILLSSFKDGLLTIFKIEKASIFIIYTVVIWICYFFMTYICFFSLIETSHLGLNAGFAIIAFSTLTILIIPGGIGVFPLSVAIILKLFDISETHGYAMGWLIWSPQTITLLLMGIYAFGYLLFKKGITYNDFKKYSQEDN